MATLQENIAETAGQIWHYLDRKGEATLAKMQKDLDLDDSFVTMGLGWLAREDKVNIDKATRSVKVSLR